MAASAPVVSGEVARTWARAQIASGSDFPDLTLPLVGGGEVKLSGPRENWLLLIVYRGLHCPICKGFLANKVLPNLEGFKEIGVDVVAVSTDTKERAEKAKEDWGLEGLPVAYGLDPEVAKTQLGLYLTEHIGASKIEGMDWFEPTVFAESGFFVINSDGKVQVVEVSNSPFGRPDVDILKGGLAFAKKAGYPPRGTA